MTHLHIAKPDYIGTTPTIVARRLRAENPGLSYRDWKALTRATLGRRFLDREVCVLRAPGNDKRMIVVDTPLPQVAEAHVEGPAIIRWVGEGGTIILEPITQQRTKSTSRKRQTHPKGQANGTQEQTIHTRENCAEKGI